LILASRSPRRRELLSRLVPDFDVISSGVAEELEPGPLTAAVARLAEMKARAVAAGHPDAVVLGADTIVVIDGNVLGKPKDVDEAVGMLRRLRGRPHEVLTGVAVIDGPRALVFTGTEITRVVMARYSDDLIDEYVASGSPFDKAGAYAIQDLDGELVESIAGSYTNVVGLPLGLTARLLVAAGLTVTSMGAP
jgi:septum formation protein